MRSYAQVRGGEFLGGESDQEGQGRLPAQPRQNSENNRDLLTLLSRRLDVFYDFQGGDSPSLTPYAVVGDMFPRAI